ncbi:MAG TPA: hypothetical protein VFP53_06265 [Sphingomicrobium sp.]|nr:hypothetical protein [Sphingomicrobium sp.]
MKSHMSRTVAFGVFLLLAACTRPQGTAPVTQPPPPASAHTRGAIIGLTAQELVARLGNPALQIREGSSLKLQFRNGRCVLDAYLYPNGNSPYRVTYVDARSPALAEVDQAACIAWLEGP